MDNAFLLGGARFNRKRQHSFAHATESYKVQGRSPGRLQIIFQRSKCNVPFRFFYVLTETPSLFSRVVVLRQV